MRYLLDGAGLGNTKFAYSPLMETANSLRLLSDQHGPSPLSKRICSATPRAWFNAVRGRLGSVPMDLLEAVVPAGHYVPDFMGAWSTNPKVTIEQQLTEFAALPRELIRHDLEDTWRDQPMPRLLEDLLAGPRPPAAVIAEALAAYWQCAVAPYWPRIHAVMDDDLAYRGGRVLTSGVLSLFEDLHPEVSMDDRVLRVDKKQFADTACGASEVVLLPSVFVWPGLMVGHDEATVFLVYAARGVGRVWADASAEPTDRDDLAALLGRNRAAILRRLEVPATTTQLARQLAQSPGTVNEHLTILKRNGLLDSWRSGRSVLYRRTSVATSILDASTDASSVS